MKKLIVIMVAIMLSMVALVACGGDNIPTGSNYEQPVSTPEQVEQPNPEPIIQQTPEPTPEPKLEMPDLTGLQLDNAINILKELQISLNIEFDFVESDMDKNIILETMPVSGTKLEEDDSVLIRYSAGQLEEIVIDFEVDEQVFYKYWEEFVEETANRFKPFLEAENRYNQTDDIEDRNESERIQKTTDYKFLNNWPIDAIDENIINMIKEYYNTDISYRFIEKLFIIFDIDDISRILLDFDHHIDFTIPSRIIDESNTLRSILYIYSKPLIN